MDDQPWVFTKNNLTEEEKKQSMEEFYAVMREHQLHKEQRELELLKKSVIREYLEAGHNSENDPAKSQ